VLPRILESLYTLVGIGVPWCVQQSMLSVAWHVEISPRFHHPASFPQDVLATIVTLMALTFLT
jgi:hypothetical protein